MATLIDTQITVVPKHKYENSSYGFSTIVDDEGISPKISVSDFSNTNNFDYNYGSLQCTHSLKYSDNTEVEIQTEYTVSNAVSVVRSDNVISFDPLHNITIDFGDALDPANHDVYDFWQKAMDNTTNYKVAMTPSIRGNKDGSFGPGGFKAINTHLASYRGNTNDNVNWFKKTYTYQVGAHAGEEYVSLTFQPNDGWTGTVLLEGWGSVTGLVNGNRKQVGVIRPYIWLNDHNHMILKFLLIQNNPDFDFSDESGYVSNWMLNLYNHLGIFTDNGKPVFTIALLPAD